MKFNPGQMVITRGVNDLIASNEEFAKHVMLSMRRHVAGDWGMSAMKTELATNLRYSMGSGFSRSIRKRVCLQYG